MSARSIFAALAALPSLALLPAPASARGADEALLPRLPAHAPPGVCYAHVKASARFSPPGPAHARWRLQPPPPGAPGPVWCLVAEPGAPPVLLEAERQGWIRVLCEGDATPVRIRGLQRRLHERGLYDGAETGRYDDGTASAMRRFQRERHIAGGGHLSLGAVAALEDGPAYAPPPPGVGPALSAGPGCCGLDVPPPPPPVVTIAVPAPVQPRSPWLTWAGKSHY